MGLELCKDCGWMHYGNDPCRAPKKSTAARKDVRLEAVKETSVRLAPASATIPAAGTQAPPVDTTIVGKRRGRPQTITDMKAYKAERERIYRARKKAET